MDVINRARTDQHGPNAHFVTIVAGISAMGGLLFGYDTGVISGAILFIQQDFGLSGGWEEIVVSSVLWGAVIGAAVGGAPADRFGRRGVLILTAWIFAYRLVPETKGRSLEEIESHWRSGRHPREMSKRSQ